MLRILTNYVESKMATDVHFRVEQSMEGKKIKALAHEINNKRMVYCSRACPTTLVELSDFVAIYDAEHKDTGNEEEAYIKAQKVIMWDPTKQEDIVALIEIRKQGASQQINLGSGLVAKSLQKSVRSAQSKLSSMNKLVSGSNFTQDTQVAGKDFDEKSNVQELYKTCYQFIKDNPVSKRKVLEEKLALAYAFLNFDKQLEKQKIVDMKLADFRIVEQTNLKKDDLIKKMIKYIEFQAGDKNAESNLKNLLDVFSLMIEESNVKGEIQDVFNDNKAIEMVLVLLSGSKPLETSLMKSLMVFCNAMLSGKNTKVQRAVFKHFKSFKQTERSLSRFANYISQITDSVRESSGKRTLLINHETSEICLEVIKFLQVCCEGHLTEMQDYFRFQPNLSNQFNFLKEIVDLLSVLSSDIVGRNYSLLILCFDALTELVQGPNRANQDFLLKSSILEILSKLIAYTSPAPDAKHKPILAASSMNASAFNTRAKHEESTHLLPWEIRKVKFKAITLLLALVEMVDDPMKVYSRLSKFFPIFLMLIYLEETYLLYKQVYGPQFVFRSMNKVASTDPVQRRVRADERVRAHRGRIQLVLPHERDSEEGLL